MLQLLEVEHMLTALYTVGWFNHINHMFFFTLITFYL